jgi:uncharacterized membrane protein YeiH
MSALVATPAPLPLHSLPTWVDVCAMAVGAAFGAATGRNRRLPLLAGLVAGVISGLAGGMIRDVLLGLEAVAIKNWYYIPAVLLAALAGGFLAHLLIQGRIPYLLARGGATADVMAGERAAIFRQAHWGAGGGRLSAFIFWLLTTYVGFWVAIVAAVLTVASLDMLSVKLGWNSLMFPGDRED